MVERELEDIYNFVLEASCTGSSIAFKAEEPVRKVQSSPDVVPYFDCDYKPTFLGSTNPSVFLEKWVYQYIKYPPAAIEKGIQGTVQVNFEIDQKGNVTNVSVVRGVHPLLDEEAVKVVAASPGWKPAKLRGNKVRTAITVGVEFRLKRRGDRGGFGINGHKF